MQSKKYVAELYCDGTARTVVTIIIATDGWVLGISNVSRTVLSVLHI